MNRVFHDHLNQFIVVFIDDILILQKSGGSRVTLVKDVGETSMGATLHQAREV
jgi:hypothetical protein